MIVCVCNSLKEKDFKKACLGCPKNCVAEEVFDALGCQPDCGSCLTFVDNFILENSMQNHAPS